MKILNNIQIYLNRFKLSDSSRELTRVNEREQEFHAKQEGDFEVTGLNHEIARMRKSFLSDICTRHV